MEWALMESMLNTATNTNGNSIISILISILMIYRPPFKYKVRHLMAETNRLHEFLPVIYGSSIISLMDRYQFGPLISGWFWFDCSARALYHGSCISFLHPSRGPPKKKSIRSNRIDGVELCCLVGGIDAGNGRGEN